MLSLADNENYCMGGPGMLLAIKVLFSLILDLNLVSETERQSSCEFIRVGKTDGLYLYLYLELELIYFLVKLNDSGEDTIPIC